MILHGVNFTIPNNLEEALKQFRFTERPRRLWVDAVCINQEGLQEREAQIKLMRDIYSTASRTLVWLGPVKTSTDQIAFTILKQLCGGMSIRRIVWERAFGSTPWEEGFDDEYKSSLERHEDLDLLTMLTNFLKLDWWKRLWVLQEVAVAAEVQLCWGDETLDFIELISAIDELLIVFRDNQSIMMSVLGQAGVTSFTDALERSVNTTSQLKHIHARNSNQEETMSERDLSLRMIEVLAKSKSREASMSHDKVYGLLGLVHADLVHYFHPSYTASESQVFRSTASQLLDLSKSFMLFNCIRDGQYYPPSWCPDWTYEFS